MADRNSNSKASSKRIPLGLSMGAAVAIAVGAATAWVTSQQQSDVPEPAPTASAVTVSPSPTAIPGGEASPAPTTPAAPAAIEQSVMVYWLKDTGRSLELSPVSTKIYAPDTPEDLLTATLNQLFAETPDETVGNAVPPQTKVLSVAVKEDGVHVDLSNDFTTGGGAASMMGRLGQLIFTASTLNPKAPVWISVAGEPLTILGGEGIEVMQPMTREQFSQNFSL